MRKILIALLMVAMVSSCASQTKIWTHPTNERYGEQWQKDWAYCEGHIPFAASMGVAGCVASTQSKNEMTRCLERRGYIYE